MKTWDKIVIDIGEKKEGDTTTITFDFLGDCTPEDVKIKKSCGCTSANWDKIHQQLHVVYTAAKIPKQVTENYQLIRKITKMEYICNGKKVEDTLTFIGKVVK